MTKKLFFQTAIIILSICLLFPSVQVAHGEIVSIRDISNHWAKNVINSWIGKGFTNGYKDDTFKPNNSITRAEFIALVNRSFKFTEKSDIAFSDAKGWYYDDLAKAIRAGYITGCSETQVCPNKAITRREAAVIISRLLKPGDSVVGDTSMFVDYDLFMDWGDAEIGIAASTKIMSGYLEADTESYYFKPNNKITRAEAIVSLDRTLAYIENTILLAGTYGPATGTRTVAGDVTIHIANVILQNMVINGNLLISDKVAEGDATLKNVVVKGTTTINGGGASSIHVENSTLESMVVNKAIGNIRIVAKGSTRIINSTLQSTATLEEDSGLKSQGFQSVTLSGPESGAASEVILKGGFEKVILNGSGIAISLPNGSIQSLTVAEDATGNSLGTSASASINAIALNALMTFTGQGSIQSVTFSDSAVDSIFERQPTRRLDSNGATILPPAAPVITSIVAMNSGNNLGLGINDSVVITFDQNTNKPVIAAASLSSAITISNGHSFGTSLLNSDITWNEAGSILTIKFSNIVGTTFAVGDSIKFQAAAGLKNSANSTTASVASSGASTGSFTSAPTITSVVAANTGNNDSLGAGDSVTITFDQNTNRPAIKAATLNTALVLNNGHSFGSNLQDRDISWNSTGNILTITFSNITAVTFNVGDTVTISASANITSQGGGIASTATSGASSGSFFTYLEVKSVVAANTGSNVGIGIGDTITITFSTSTNTPVISAADFKTWFTVMSGHSFGTNLVKENITWTSNTTLTIRFTDVTGVTFVPGDSILIQPTANIRDFNKRYPSNYMLSPPSTGSFSFAPAITAVYAANAGNNTGLGIGDTITIVFNQPTNRPVFTGSSLNTLLLVSGGHTFGTNLSTSNIYWNVTGDILTISFNTIAGVTFAVGDIITPTKAANIRDASGMSLEAVAASPKSTGSFSPLPATPGIVNAVATNTGKVTGLNKGDTLTITFNQKTNKPTVTAASLNKWFTVANGNHFGTVGSANWNANGDILTITMNILPTDSTKYIRVSDVIQISTDASIKDLTGISNAYSGSVTITGSFSSPPTITKLKAGNPDENVGLDNGDTLELLFDRATNKPKISAEDLVSWFAIGSSHSFGTGLNDDSAVWNESGTQLTITFDNVDETTTLVYGDTIRLTATSNIMDAVGEIRASEAAVSSWTGSFTTPPRIISFDVDSDNYDGILNAGDIISIGFDQPTNMPAITNAAALNSVFKFRNSLDSELPKFATSNINSINWTRVDGEDFLNIILKGTVTSSITDIEPDNTYVDVNPSSASIKDIHNSIQSAIILEEEGYYVLSGNY